MNDLVASKLEKLRADYARIKGYGFEHFYCPILFTDEDVPLCEAHIVNRAFRNSSRAWTIQRSDVDAFYGSRFEADFVTVEYYSEDLSPGEVLVNKSLASKYRPQILVDNRPVGYFIIRDDVPKNFTAVQFVNSEHKIQLGLKMSPEEFGAIVERKWEIAVHKDVRIPSLVSLIKSAHLTLFEIFGYRYAFSSGGFFVGKDILGKFFLDNYNESKSTTLKKASHFFQEFVHMVRPIEGLNLEETIADGHMLICRGHRYFWALIVFIRTFSQLHAVMIPVFDEPNAVERFLSFLNNKNELIEVETCFYRNDRWEYTGEVFSLKWPKEGLLYP